MLKKGLVPMSDYSGEFYRRLESIVADIDDILEDYQMTELYDCETEITDARDTLSETLYKISRM